MYSFEVSDYSSNEKWFLKRCAICHVDKIMLFSRNGSILSAEKIKEA